MPVGCAVRSAATSTTPCRRRVRRLPVPAAARSMVTTGSVSTQEAFGRVLASLADVDGVGERMVTTAPDVSISTNLGGFINKRGVYSHVERDDHGGADRLLKWAPGPTGQHIELGISEMNLFMLLGQLGLSHDHHGQHLLPVGTVYDPFVLRGLDALIYGLYNDAKFVVAGTPAGRDARTGGRVRTSRRSPRRSAPSCRTSPTSSPRTRPRSTGCCATRSTRSAAPTARAAICGSRRDRSTRRPFAAVLAAEGEERLRQQVLAGGYRLRDAPDDGRPGVTIVTTGVMAPDALAAAEELDVEGVQATVIHLTSPDRVYRSWRDGFARSTADVAGRPGPEPAAPARAGGASGAGRWSASTTRRATASPGSARRSAPVSTRSASTGSASPARSPTSIDSPGSMPAASSTPRSIAVSEVEPYEDLTHRAPGRLRSGERGSQWRSPSPDRRRPSS